MIEITDAAAKHLASIIEKENGIGLRISIKKTGCSGYMYVPQVISKEIIEDIRIITKQGIKIFLDSKCEEMIVGTVVDYVSKNLGVKQLEFHNPNATSLCGCGESFKLKADHGE